MLDYLNLQQTVGRQIIVKDHTSALLGHLYTSRANADLTVIVSDARANSSVSSSSFRCHGAILAAVSGYFESLLHFNCITSPSSSSEQASHTVTTSSHTSEVSLDNINCDTFEKVLEFVYTGTVNISQHTAVDILKAADFLQVFTALPFE